MRSPCHGHAVSPGVCSVALVTASLDGGRGLYAGLPGRKGGDIFYGTGESGKDMGMLL